ncbi:hypothetical protein OIU76_002556 [Salix suchowensis]|nr:hypothetical protein OIU76_002556 [Salix suchowensis]
MAQLEVEFLHECFRTNFSGIPVVVFCSRNCIRMKRNSAHRPGQDFAGPSKIYLLARKLERQSHLEPHFEAPGFCAVLPDNKEAAELFNSIIDENLSCLLRVTNTLAARMPCQTKPMLASGNGNLFPTKSDALLPEMRRFHLSSILVYLMNMLLCSSCSIALHSDLDGDIVVGERSSTGRGKTMMVEDVHLLKRFWRN